MNAISNNRGSALIVVLMSFVVISILGMAIIGVTTAEHNLTRVDGRSQSTYYIAESGIPYIISEIESEMDTMINSSNSGDEFFNTFEAQFVGRTFQLDDFEKNIDEQPPKATITLEPMATDPGEEIPGTRYYKIISVGKNGNSTRTVSSVIGLVWQSEQVSGFMDDVSLFGSKFMFKGNEVHGDNCTIVVGGITTEDLNQGNFSGVSNIYFNGAINIHGGSSSFGSNTEPGNIYVNGDLFLTSGTRNVYGDVFVNGNAKLKDAIFHGNVYVNGNVEFIENGPDLRKEIFYTGTMVYPSWYEQSFLDKCNKVDSVPSFTIPTLEIVLREDSWYAQNGYVVVDSFNEKVIQDNEKYFLTGNFTSNDSTSPGGEIVIISKNGNIDISGWRHITGVLIAPNGYITLDIGSFTGVIIAKGVINASHGGSHVYLRRLSDFFTPSEMPINVSGGTGSGTGTEINKNVEITRTPYQEL